MPVHTISTALYTHSCVYAKCRAHTGFSSIAAASKPNSMNFWLALDPATVTNGCLHVSPGSHTARLPHHDHPIQGRVIQAGNAAGLAELVLSRGSFPLLHLIFSYYAEGCMVSCMRDHIIRYFPQVPIELGPGDAIFFDSALAHMSPPNRSDHSRRAYACIYGAADMRYVAPETSEALAEATPAYHFEPVRGTRKNTCRL